MKCILTGNETLDKVNNIPVSREARPLVKQLKNKTNELIRENLFTSMKNESEERGLPFEEEKTKEFLLKNTLKLGRKTVLNSLQNGDKIVKEALEAIKGE